MMAMLGHLRPVMALFWQGDRRMLGYGVLLSFTTALAGIALLGLSGWFIAATAIAGATVATALAFDVFMPSAGIRLLALGRTASRYGERLTTHDATLRVLAHLRERLFRGWARPDTARALATNPSRLLFRLTIDIDALDSLYLRVIVPVLAAAGTTVAVAVALTFIHPLLGLAAAMLLLVIGLGVPLLAARRTAASARRRAHALEAMRARAIDLVRGQADLAMANRLGAQVRAVAAADARLAEADLSINRSEADVSLALGCLGAALLAGMLLAVAWLAENGTIGAPVAALAIFLAMAAVEPFAALRRGSVEFGRTLQAARRLGQSLVPNAAGARHGAAPLKDAAVRLANVVVHQATFRAPVLESVSLAIPAGQRIAVTGASGAGKSTLLNLLAGELPASSGTVETARHGLLTQRTELFNDTLRGNLALADPVARDMDMLAALEAAGLADFVVSLPAGLDTVLGEGGSGISAGQARRLALARLLLRDAPVWLLDEPTEGVDRATARDVLARLAAKSAGRTLVIATHTSREASLADRIVVLRDGRIVGDVARGSPAFDTELSKLRPD